MKTSATKCLLDQIGMANEAHKKAYEKLLKIGDVISETGRMFDANCGALTFAYLAVSDGKEHNDLLHESFKHFLRENQKLVDEMISKIQKIAES